MYRTNRKLSRLLSIALTTVLAAGLATIVQADFDKQYSLQADSLVIHNLIGEITVEGHSGGSFEVEVRARGKDVSPGNLRIETDEGSRARLSVLFPLDSVTHYVYPALGRKSETRIHLDSGKEGLSGLLSRIFNLDSSRIHVSGSGRGLEMWADLTVRVPSGSRVEIHHGVGHTTAQGIDGEVSLDTKSGRVEARSIRGDLSVDTGSGRVVVEQVTGDLNVDTGSGRVELASVQGDRVVVDTGSGSINFHGIDARSVSMDTGSGGVRGTGLSTDDAEIDTGSGSVEIQFDRVGDGQFTIDTGSGSIKLGLPPDASATIHAETGSGRIYVDIDGAQLQRIDRDEAVVTLGSGAARFVLDTGSGSIRINPAD